MGLEISSWVSLLVPPLTLVWTWARYWTFLSIPYPIIKWDRFSISAPLWGSHKALAVDCLLQSKYYNKLSWSSLSFEPASSGVSILSFPGEVLNALMLLLWKTALQHSVFARIINLKHLCLMVSRQWRVSHSKQDGRSYLGELDNFSLCIGKIGSAC